MSGRKIGALHRFLLLIRAIRKIRGSKCLAGIRGSQGFTLIEVLIAMGIIGVSLIALVTLFPLGLRSSRLAGDFTTASFIGQQALDTIRANAQVFDPADTFFDNTTPPPHVTGLAYSPNNTNHNGLGYYELPVSAVKGYLSPIRFPREPAQAQWWEIEITVGGTPATYQVTNSIAGLVSSIATPPQTNSLFTSTDNAISFILYHNPTAYYDDFDAGDKLRINLEMRGGVPYYWYAMRAPITEDRNLNGALDFDEDTGLDLIPDYWDRNRNSRYDIGIDPIGETGFDGTNDPHGDNYFARDSIGAWTTTVVNSGGTEGNGVINAWPDDYIQKVTVTVGWREGGQDRFATFSASVANQFR